MAAPTTSVAKSMTSSAIRRSPDSRSCRATVTAFGPAMPPPYCHPPSSSRSGSVSSAPRWPALGRWRLMSTVFPRIIRSVRCSWPIGQRVSPNGPTTCSSSTASARASNTPRLRPEARSRRFQSETFPHLEFVDMGGHGYATVRLTSDEMRTEFICIPRPSRAAIVPMAVLFATGSSTRHRSGNRASGLCCASKSLRAIPAFRSEMAPGR